MEILSTIGSFIIIKPSAPQLNVVSIDGYSDLTIGETGSRFFIKEFRHTIDGVTWSSWATLSVGNLSVITTTFLFDLEYRYTRAGTDATGDLEWHWTLLNITTSPNTNADVFTDSLFADFFDQDDSEALGWCTNVLRKLYEPGIIPKYLVRNENQNESGEDADYIDFWRSITCFFSYIVRYAREFEDFDQSLILLREYLEQRGLLVGTEYTLAEMQDMMQNSLLLFSKRGTLSDLTELHNLIGYDSNCDEFQVSSDNATGWVIGVTSPIDTYITGSGVMNKLGADVFTMPGTYTQTVVDTFDVMDIGGGKTVGWPIYNASYSYAMSYSQPYEITFYAKKAVTGNLTLDLFSYDKSGTAIAPPVLQTVLVVPAGRALTNLVLPTTTDWYFIRVIIYPSTQVVTGDPLVDTPNIGEGYNARWVNDTACRFNFQMFGDGAGSVYIRELTFKILSTDYSRVLLSGQPLIELWLKNSAGEDLDIIRKRVRRDLLPYGGTKIINFVD